MANLKLCHFIYLENKLLHIGDNSTDKLLVWLTHTNTGIDVSSVNFMPTLTAYRYGLGVC